MRLCKVFTLKYVIYILHVHNVHICIYKIVYVHIYNCAYVDIQNTINFNIAGNFTWYFFHIIQTRKLPNMLKYMINFT